MVSFTFTIPEERRCVEFIAPDVVLFDQYKPGFDAITHLYDLAMRSKFRTWR